MMKRMFHGTVDACVPSIRLHGLRPDKQHAWHIAIGGEELREHEKVNSVYLTPDRHRAMQYAKTRAAYFATKPGHKFEMFDSHGMILKKDADAPVLLTNPVVLVIDIPEALADKMEMDAHDWMEGSVCLHGTVPPSMIVDVVQVTDEFIEQVREEHRHGASDREADSLLMALAFLSGQNPHDVLATL